MAAQAQRQWEQVCRILDQQVQLCSSGPLAGRQESQQPHSSTQICLQLRNLLLAIDKQPAAPRAVWKKLLQQQVPCKLLKTCVRLFQTRQDLALWDGLTAAGFLLSRVSDELQLGPKASSLSGSLTAQMQRSGLLQTLPGMLDNTARKLQAAADPAVVLDASASTHISSNTSGSSSTVTSSSGSSGGGGDMRSTSPSEPSSVSAAGISSTGSAADQHTPASFQPQYQATIEDVPEQLLLVWLSAHQIMHYRAPLDTQLPAGRLAVAALQYLSNAHKCSGRSGGSADRAERHVPSREFLHRAVQCLLISTSAVQEVAGLTCCAADSSGAARQLLQDPDLFCSLAYSLVLSMLAVWQQQQPSSSSSAGGAPAPSEQVLNVTGLASDMPKVYSAVLQHLGCCPELGVHAADIAGKSKRRAAPGWGRTNEARVAAQVMEYLTLYRALLQGEHAALLQAADSQSSQQQQQQQQRLSLHLLLAPAMLQWVADSPSNLWQYEYGHALACEAAVCALQHMRDLSAVAAAASTQAATHALRQLQLGMGVGETCVSLLRRVAPVFLQKWRALFLHHCIGPQAATASALPVGMIGSGSGSGDSSSSSSSSLSGMQRLQECAKAVDKAADMMLSLALPFEAPLRGPMQLSSGSSAGELCLLLEDNLRSGLYAHNLLCLNAAIGSTSTSSSSNRGSVSTEQQLQVPESMQVKQLPKAAWLLRDRMSDLRDLLAAHITASRSLVDSVALQLYGLLVSMLKIGTNSSSMLKNSSGLLGSERGQHSPTTVLQAQQIAVAQTACQVLQCQHWQQDEQAQPPAAVGTEGLPVKQALLQQQSATGTPFSSSLGSVSASVDATELLPWLALLGRLLLQWGGELQQLHEAPVQAVESTAAVPAALQAAAPGMPAAAQQAAPPGDGFTAHLFTHCVAQAKQVDAVSATGLITPRDPQQQAGSSSTGPGQPALIAYMQHLNMAVGGLYDVVKTVTRCLQADGCDAEKQLSQLGYDIALLLQQLNSTREVIDTTDERDPDSVFASSVQEMWQLLVSAGHALTAFAHPYCCNNPVCGNVEGPSEAALVGGCSCICAGCNTARYCCKQCQKAHWKQHKPVCKALAAAAAAIDDAGASTG